MRLERPVEREPPPGTVRFAAAAAAVGVIGLPQTPQNRAPSSRGVEQ